MKKEQIIRLADEMKIGWNLGNTLDAVCGKSGHTPAEHETAWGNPVTTREMLAEVYRRGFKTLRLPTSWGCETEGDDFIISKSWMKRVRELVDIGLELGFTVILNSHHDNGFYYPKKDNYDRAYKYITCIWRQIAAEFSGYGNKLIFESMNEPRLAGTPYEWNGMFAAPECEVAREILNNLNDAFVSAVRQAGGCNSDRILMIAPYAAAYGCALTEDFRIPEGDNIAISIHNYPPYDFAMNKNGTDDFNPENPSDFDAINGFMKSLYEKFVSNGYPVIIGECGATNKNNNAVRIRWGEFFTSTAKKYGLVCVLWDNGGFGVGEENFGLFKRDELTWGADYLVDALMNGLK